MEIVISGSRSIKNVKHVERAIAQSGWQISHIRHGGAGGVDQMAALTAVRLNIPFQAIPAQWDNFSLRKVIKKFRYDGHEYNAAAGMVRNEDMVLQIAPDGGLIAVWDGESPGTANCIAHAIVNDVATFIYLVDGNKPDDQIIGYHVNNTNYLKEFAKDVINLGYKKASIKWRGNRYARH